MLYPVLKGGCLWFTSKLFYLVYLNHRLAFSFYFEIKRLLEGQAEAHKRNWERGSMPKLCLTDKRAGLRFHCPIELLRVKIDLQWPADGWFTVVHFRLFWFQQLENRYLSTMKSITMQFISYCKCNLTNVCRSVGWLVDRSVIIS